MFAQKLITDGFLLNCDGDRLRVEPASQLTQEHRNFIRLHKSKILTELTCYDAGEIADTTDQEFDADMFRARPEAVVPASLSLCRDRWTDLSSEPEEQCDIRATVRCGDCQHFQRDTVNPKQGRGSCNADKTPGYPYPMAKRLCPSFQGLENISNSEQKLPRCQNQLPIESFPEWQRDFCSACGDFNNWRGRCPRLLDDCTISKIIETNGNLDQLRGLDLGQGITTDQVIEMWLQSGEPEADLIDKPAWLICIAEHIKRGRILQVL